MKNTVCVNMSGPLIRYQQGYQQHMSDLSFSVSAAKRHLCLMAHLSRWMNDNSVTCVQLDDFVEERFFADRCAMGYVRFRPPKGLSQLLAYLRELDVVTKPIQFERIDAAELLLEKFTKYLAEGRGLCAASIVGYRRPA